MSDMSGSFPPVGTPNPSNPRIGPQLNEILRQYGLESLSGWASRAVINGWSEDQIMLELYQRPEFKARFPALGQREAAGLPPLSVQEYLDYERMVSSLGSMWGLRLDKSEVDGLIAGDVSPQEVEERFTIAATAVYQSDIETRNELGRLFGIGTGDLMRYWMDPGKELGNLQQRYRVGEIAGAALRSGYGQITASQGQRLADVGLTRDSAAQGFAQLSRMGELFNPIDSGEDAIGQESQIEFLAGSEPMATMIEERTAKRKAEFEGSGGYSAGPEGFAVGEAD